MKPASFNTDKVTLVKVFYSKKKKKEILLLEGINPVKFTTLPLLRHAELYCLNALCTRETRQTSWFAV